MILLRYCVLPLILLIIWDFNYVSSFRHSDQECAVREVDYCFHHFVRVSLHQADSDREIEQSRRLVCTKTQRIVLDVSLD